MKGTEDPVENTDCHVQFPSHCFYFDGPVNLEQCNGQPPSDFVHT